MKKGGRAKITKIDFGGVEQTVGARGRKIPEGNYLCKIVSVERRKGEKSKQPYFNWKFQVLENSRGSKKQRGVPLYFTTSLQPDALFNLRNLIYSASDGKKNVAGKAVNFDPNSLIGQKIGVVVEDDEYEKKIRSKAVDVMPPSSLVEDDDEDDEDDDDEDLDEDDEDEDDDEEDDEDEDDDEDDDEEADDEEEEDEPEPPKKKKQGKKGKKAKKGKKDDDLDDVDEDDV